MKKKENSVLGRGLEAVLGESYNSSSINDLPIDAIVPNEEQPRKIFDPHTLEELASSIKNIGLVQPITVKKLETGKYMIISGERRWRASQMIGLHHIAAYVTTVDDEQLMEMALIENIQREDLNAIEIALAYKKILENTDMQQDQLSVHIGKSRATISNYLRLLGLPSEIQLGLTQGKIDMGHARTLLSLPKPEDRLAIYAEILEKKLTVREVERICKEIVSQQREKVKKSPIRVAKIKEKSVSGADFKILSAQLTHFFKLPVNIESNKKGKGSLTINFSSEEELMSILTVFEKAQDA